MTTGGGTPAIPTTSGDGPSGPYLPGLGIGGGPSFAVGCVVARLRLRCG
jgi:hypothetical protein